MEIIDFLTHHWIIGIIGVILVIIIIGSLIKAAIKFAILALIIGFVLVAVVGLTPNEVLHKGKAAVDGVTKIYQNTIDPILEKEIDKADYQTKPNGEYTIKTKDVKITGKKGDKNITINYNGKAYHINSDLMSKQIKEKLDSVSNTP